MSDSLTGHLDTPLSSYSSPLMSHYPNPHLASPKSQGLRSMLGSTTGQNHRQQSQYLATTRRVSPDIFAAIGDIMRVLVKDETGASVIFLKRWPETITLGAWLFWPFFHLQSRSTLQRQRGMEEEEELEGEGEDEEEDEELEEEEMYESELEEGQHTSRQSYAAQYAEMRRWQK